MKFFKIGRPKVRQFFVVQNKLVYIIIDLYQNDTINACFGINHLLFSIIIRN